MQNRLNEIQREAAPLLSEQARSGQWATVVAFLGPVPRSQDDPEERTCDRCRRYEPDCCYYAVQIPVSPLLLVCGGLCAVCAEAEGMETNNEQ